MSSYASEEKTLTINGKNFNYSNLIGDHFQQLSDYEQQTLDFANRWNSGNTTFSQETSGSTGKPQIITLKRAQMEMSAKMTGEALNLQAGDRALVPLSTLYIAGKMMIVRAMELGLHLEVISPCGNPYKFTQKKYDFMPLVPLQLNTMIAEGDEVVAWLNQFKVIILGGAPVSHELKMLIRDKLSTKVYETYGMTETVSHIALKQLNTIEENFCVLPNTRIALDSRGCLKIQSPVTNNEWIQTNDLADILDEKHFIWKGRIDNVINSGGIKIQLEEVEQDIEVLLHNKGASHRFFLFPQEDQVLGEQLEMVIETTSNKQFTDYDYIETVIKTSLDKFKAPKKIHYIDYFAETGSGKIDRFNTIQLL